jgi:radical SAM superfamily enzyme YgiQ (UPF0313 family)
MKKLLLINPMGRRSGFLLSKITTFPPLGLAYIAAVTPSHWEVKIVDEGMEEFVFEEADLVGITGFTSNINRAYEIAQLYRDRNIKVIMGGIHASMLPDEALNYADCVVIGEVEGIWAQVIEDFEQDRLASRYTGPQIDLSDYSVTPRRELLHPDYLWNSVQTSRGCPFDCHFCSVSKHMGSKYRQRCTERVLDELESIKGEHVVFVDDNLIGYSPESKDRAMELFQGMIKRNLRKKWWMQTSINAVEDERVIELAAKAGCMFAFIGFESIMTGTLKDMKKGINLKIGIENYKKVIDTFHKYGVAVYGAFIIANDHEPDQYYKELADFMVRAGVDIVQVTILTPLPGTKLMQELEAEKRLLHQDFPKDWDKYRFSHIVHKVLGTTSDKVYSGNNRLKKQIYTFPVYQYRMLKSALKLRNFTNFYVVYKMNQAMKKGWLNSHYKDRPAPAP